MTMRRVLVLGSSGMLGVAVCHYLRQSGFDVVTLDRVTLDARNPDLRTVASADAGAVVNALGLINRRADQPEADFLRVNSLFPRRLADLCQQRGIPLIHISTDCVFKGDAGPYDESAPPSAVDLYGMSKYWGEPANAMVIRTSIIGPEINNFYSLLCWFLKQEGAVRGFRNHLWNGVTTVELGRAIATILERGLWQPGLRHVHGEDLTKCELLQLMQQIYETPCAIEPVDDAYASDTRLRTLYPDFLDALDIAPMQTQLARLRPLSDRYGHWSAGS